MKNLFESDSNSVLVSFPEVQVRICETLGHVIRGYPVVSLPTNSNRLIVILILMLILIIS